MSAKKPSIPRDLLPDHFPGTTSQQDSDALEKVVRLKVAAARLDDQADSFVAFMLGVTADYQRAQARDEPIAGPGNERTEVVVWPGQINDFIARLKIAAEQLAFNKGEPLSEATDRLKMQEIEGTIIRATTVSPFAFEDARDVLDRMISDLERRIESTGGPARRWKKWDVTHARQFNLARQFWRAFIVHGWHIKTSETGLMHQLFKLVIEAAGEKRVTITRLLNSAKPDT